MRGDGAPDRQVVAVRANGGQFAQCKNEVALSNGQSSGSDADIACRVSRGRNGNRSGSRVGEIGGGVVQKRDDAFGKRGVVGDRDAKPLWETEPGTDIVEVVVTANDEDVSKFSRSPEVNLHPFRGVG